MATRPIDEKLVVMKLDNADFKRKASETTSIFGKLKSVFSKSGDTNLNNVTKELGNITSAANRVDMSGLGRSVDTIAGRFTNLGVIATTALTNITNKAVDAGLRIQKSLTTDQVMDGFREYELKIGSIGTMLANTEHAGSTLEDVKKTLGELNDYADKTIYNFGQMTQNIGRFTAAGVGLEESTIAIKGLGNLAAISGSTSEQLNNAMYQMSQAMGPGYKLNLLDWTSLQNAGMGGKKTQDSLKETAKSMGKVINESKTFRESISDGWLTSEVLLETLKKFGEDESMTEAATKVRTFTGFMDSLKEGIGSGWAETWELIFGDFEQATRLWTAVSNMAGGFFQKQTDARNNFIKGAIDSGAIEKLGQVVRNVGTPIVQLFKAIGGAFKSAFPPVESTGLVSFLTTMANLTVSLKMNASTVENIKTIFQGLFSIIGIGVEVFKILVGAVLGLIPGFDGAGGGITAFVANFAKIPIAILEYLKTGDLAEKITNKLRAVFETLGGVLSFIGGAFMGMSSLVNQAMTALGTGGFTEGVLKEDSKVLEALVSIRGGFENLFGFITSINFGAIGGGITSFFEGIGNTFEWVTSKFKAVVDFFKGFFPMLADNQGWILAGGGLAATGAIIWKVYETFKSIMDIGGNFAETLEGVSDALGAFTLGIHSKSLLMIAIAVGVLAGSLMLLSNMDGKQIATSLTAVVVSLGALVGALAIINKADLSGGTGAILAIIGLSIAVGILSLAVAKLGDIPIPEATKGVVAITALLGALSGAMILMSKYSGTFTASAAQLVAVSAAIGLIVFSLKQLADMNPSELAKGATTIGILLLELALFIKIASTRSSTLATGAAGILATAGAIVIMVHAIKQISDIKPDQITKGLLTIGALLTAIGIFALGVKDTKLVAMGVSLMLLAGAINALIIPILTLGNAKLETLAVGLGAIALALGAFALSSSFLSATIPAAIAITILAVALNLLVIPIAALGQLSWESILKGVGGLALGLLAFGGVAAILGIVSPAIVIFSVAIAALGVGFLALGTGMKLLATSLILLSTMTVGAVTVMVGAFGAFFTAIIALLPTITDLIMKVILAMTEVVVKMAPKIGDAIGKLLVIIMEKIVEYTPQIVELIGKLLVAILEKLQEYIPEAIVIIGDALVEILEAIGGFVDDAVTAILDFLLTLIGTFAEYIPKFIDAGTELILGFLDGLSENIPLILESMAEFMITLVDSMATTIDENGHVFIDSIMNLMGQVFELVVIAGLSIIEALFSWIPGISEVTAQIGATAGKYIEENFKAYEIGDGKGGEFADGVGSTSEAVRQAGLAIANYGKTGMESVDASDSGAWFGSGFINGITSKAGEVYNSAWNLASQAYNAIVDRLDINSPSLKAHQLGEFTGAGFSNGVNSTQKSAIESFLGWATGMRSTTKSMTKEATKQGTNVGYSATKGVSKGLKKGAPKAKKTAKKTAKDIASAASKTFNEQMEILDYKFEMGEIDQKKHIEGIKKLVKQYGKYPELVRKGNLEIRKIEKDIEKDREQAAKDAIQREKDIFSKRKALIDDRKYYNTMSMKQELETWERMQARYKEGTDERKEADREVYRLKKEMYQKMTDLNQEYFEKVKETNQKLIEDEKALNQEYEDELASRTESIRSGLGNIFAEFTVDAEVSGTKLLDNLRSQLNGMMNWSRQLKELASKGIDEGLLEELRQMGPSAASEINALSKMTALQLQEYSGIWKATNELARVEAVGELEWLREDTDKQIEQLRKDSKQQLEEYKQEWLKKMREIRYGTPDEFDGLDATMESIGKDAMKGLLEGLKSMEGPLVNEAKSIANSVAKTMGNVLGANVSAGFMNSSTIDKAKNGAKAVKDAVNNVLDSINRDVKINVSVDGDLPNGNVKMKATTEVPDSSYTSRMLNSINQPTLNKTTGVAVPETAYNDKTNSAINSLAASIAANSEKSTIVPVYLDGKKITEVVSRNQYGNKNIGSMTRGVI